MSLIPKSCLNSEEKVSPIFSLWNYTLSHNSLFSSVSAPSCDTCTYQLSVTALHCTAVLCTVQYIGHVTLSQWLRQVSPGPSCCTHRTCEASSRDHLKGTDSAMLSTCLLCWIYFRSRTQVYACCMIKEFTFITSPKQMQ